VKPDEPKPDTKAAQDATDWIGDLLQRAQKGDKTVLPQIREVLASPEVTDALGNLSRRAEGTIVEQICGSNLAMQEGLAKKLTEMRAELNGPDPSPLERHLVERVVLCWLAVHDAELRAAVMAALAPNAADAWQRRIDAAHKRHLSAIRTLATVRKLAMPIIVGQLNIAQKQVNRSGVQTTGA
jgi:hypothetical protein